MEKFNSRLSFSGRLYTASQAVVVVKDLFLFGHLGTVEDIQTLVTVTAIRTVFSLCQFLVQRKVVTSPGTWKNALQL